MLARSWFGLALACAVTATLGAQSSTPAYRVDFLPTPGDEVIEVGGMDFLADGRLIVSTRRGEVWIVDDALADDPSAARWTRFADGLHEGLGLRIVDDRIFVVQRMEVAELRDVDGDGRCDRVDRVASGWGCTGNYHEFAFGLPFDAASDSFYVGLNLGFFSPYWYLGQSDARWRGWVLKVGRDGSVTPYASGFRSPNGLGINAAGDLFVTDNQGDWMPSCPLYHVREGAFHGHPASLKWTDAYGGVREPDWYAPTTAPRHPAAIWLPYELTRSTGNLVFADEGGRFGPFDGQAFAAELTNGLVLRCDLEKVRGVYQGAALPFVSGVGAANRVRFAADGTLFCGLTSRGWGGEGAAHGVSRIRRVGEPMAIRSVRVRSNGFAIEFTRPLAKPLEIRDVEAELYDLEYWWKYGSPERQRAVPLGVTNVETSDDRRRATVTFDSLEPGYNARVRLASSVVADDGTTPLMDGWFVYTINQLPTGPYNLKPVAVPTDPPPTTREQEAEGRLLLTDMAGHCLTPWEGGETWQRCGDGVLTTNGTHMILKDGGAFPAAPASATTPLRSIYAIGDAEVTFEFKAPIGARAAVQILGGDELAFPVPADVDIDSWQQVRFRYADGAVVAAEHNGVDCTDRFADAIAPNAPATGPLVLLPAPGRGIVYRKVSVKLDREPFVRDGWVDLLANGLTAYRRHVLVPARRRAARRRGSGPPVQSTRRLPQLRGPRDVPARLPQQFGALPARPARPRLAEGLRGPAVSVVPRSAEDRFALQPRPRQAQPRRPRRHVVRLPRDVPRRAGRQRHPADAAHQRPRRRRSRRHEPAVAERPRRVPAAPRRLRRRVSRRVRARASRGAVSDPRRAAATVRSPLGDDMRIERPKH